MFSIVITIVFGIKYLLAYDSVHYYIRHDEVFSDADSDTNLQHEQGVTFKHCVLLCSRLDECCTASYEEGGGVCQLNSHCCPPTVARNDSKVLMRHPSIVPSANPRDCTDFMPGTCSGVYFLVLQDGRLFYAVCDMETDGGHWTVIQKRFDGSVSFYRSWEQYKWGFGNIDGEFWYGNENIHGIVSGSTKSYKIRFDLVDFADDTVYAEYSEFYVESEDTDYTITLDGYSGNAGNAMADFNLNSINGMRFSTPDRDNDVSAFHCARDMKQAGFWFRDCARANVNGIYNGAADRAMNWRTWHDYDALKETKMMIKPL